MVLERIVPSIKESIKLSEKLPTFSELIICFSYVFSVMLEYKEMNISLGEIFPLIELSVLSSLSVASSIAKKATEEKGEFFEEQIPEIKKQYHFI